MGEISMSVDRKATNGKGSRRIDSGGDLSTTVQSGKAVSSFLKTLQGEFSADSQAQSDIKKYADYNVQQARTESKSLRNISDAPKVQAPSGKGAGKQKVAPGKPTPSVRNPVLPSGPSDQDIYFEKRARAYKEGGENI